MRRAIPYLGTLSNGTLLAGILLGGTPALTYAADPTDADVSVPSTTYRSALPATERTYLEQTDVERLPWRKLFESDGRFAPEPGIKPSDTSRSTITSREHKSTTQPSASSAAGPGSDAQGVVKYVDSKRGRVKLKHGPIDRLEMPGMTMVFRVKDPTLLNDLKPGDKVGFTVEVDGSKFYVTGFQK